jgi:hypothetical protein
MRIGIKSNKICKIMQQNFLYLKYHTMNQICIESEFKYALFRQICKCLKFRALVINDFDGFKNYVNVKEVFKQSC